LLLIGATMFGAKTADAQVRAANLTLITPVENASEYVIRPSVAYGLPGEVNGFTLIDFNRTGGYFGKTILSNPSLTL
jgi:hypothetical protein